jgi:multimeric flavodoxin WrbA
MKTLIFNGSPRKNGNTAALIKELTARLEGDVKIVRAYDCDVKPCIDCRYCWKNSGCAVKDGMQELYGDIQEADNIVIASPTHFSELTGQLLAVLSRLQTFWCAKYLRNEKPVPKAKRGGIIIVRGGEGELNRGIETAKVLLYDMNAKPMGTIFADNSDNVPSVEQKNVMDGIEALAAVLNGTDR